MITVKEFAETHGKTVQAVYQQMNRKENRSALEGHIIIEKVGNKKVKFLDDFAVELLEKASNNTPSIVIQQGNEAELERLRDENKNLLIKVAELQEALLREKDEVKRLQDDKILLLEEKTKKKWWHFGR